MYASALALILALLPVDAAAADVWASENQRATFLDVHEVFSVVTYDTGFLPSASSPIAVRFHVTPTGGVVSELQGTSYLEWERGQRPEAPEMDHSLLGEAGGWFGVDAAVDIGAEVSIDIAGLYSSVVPLWTTGVDLYEGVPVDSLLLNGGHAGAEVSLKDASLIDPLEFSITVFPGLDLVLLAKLYPELTAKLTGHQVETAFDHAHLVQANDGEWVTLPAPTGQPAVLAGTSSYVGAVDAVLAFVIEPTVELDTFLGTFTLAAFPIPIDLVDRSEIRTFDPVPIHHPLPAVGELPAAHDFGERQVGSLANWQLGYENLGELGLEGFVRIEGPDSFTVWPEFVYATEEFDDGVVVSFEPKLEGRQEAWLVVETADPGVPEVRILLSGTGFEPEPEGGDRFPEAEPEVGRSGGSTCGCSTGSGAPLWLVWLAPLLLLRRRR